MVDDRDIDVDFEGDFGGGALDADAGISLEAIKLAATNESIRELMLPIIAELTLSVVTEIADVEFFLSTSPLGELEVALTDDSGLTAEIDAVWESL